MSFEEAISEISTEDLIKEVNKRKDKRLPILINQINSAIKEITPICFIWSFLLDLCSWSGINKSNSFNKTIPIKA